MLTDEFHPLDGGRVALLAPDGSLDNARRPEDLDDAELLRLYDQMVLLRSADQVALSLQRAGRMGTYPPTLGQEATVIGSAAALAPQDWVVPSFRELGAMFLKGVPLRLLYLYWMGSEWGSHFPEGVRVLPVCAPVGTQTLHGVGLAWAAKLKGEAAVTLIYFGDGATSKGDFHEGLNFAGVFQTPCVFVCQNNQFSISVPRQHQTAAATLAQKAVAYGFPGLVVDGNDLVAVYAATREAVARARSGGGPTLIEAQTYRLGPHTTADDPTRYRTEAELAAQAPYDPLLRVRLYLERQGLLTAAEESQRQERHEEFARQEAREAEALISADPDEMFDYTFAQLPAYLQTQKDYLHRVRGDQQEAAGG